MKLERTLKAENKDQQYERHYGYVYTYRAKGAAFETVENKKQRWLRQLVKARFRPRTSLSSQSNGGESQSGKKIPRCKAFRFDSGSWYQIAHLKLWITTGQERSFTVT